MYMGLAAENKIEKALPHLGYGSHAIADYDLHGNLFQSIKRHRPNIDWDSNPPKSKIESTRAMLRDYFSAALIIYQAMDEYYGN